MANHTTHYVKAPWHLAPYLFGHMKPAAWGTPHAEQALAFTEDLLARGQVLIGITDVLDDVATYSVIEVG